jgi:hypothetical protein
VVHSGLGYAVVAGVLSLITGGKDQHRFFVLGMGETNGTKKAFWCVAAPCPAPAQDTRTAARAYQPAQCSSVARAAHSRSASHVAPLRFFASQLLPLARTRRVRQGFAQHAQDGRRGARGKDGGDAARHAEAASVAHDHEKLLQVRVLRAAACCRTLALSPYLPSARLRAENEMNANAAPAVVVSDAEEEPAQRRSVRVPSKKTPAAAAAPRTKNRKRPAGGAAPPGAAPPGAGALAAEKEKEKKKQKKEAAAAKKSLAAAEEGDGSDSDSCGQRQGQGEMAPKKNRTGDDPDSNDSASSERRPRKKAPKNKKNRKGESDDSDSNDSVSSDSRERRQRKKHQRKKAPKKNRNERNDSDSNDSASSDSDSGDRPAMGKGKGKEVEKKVRSSITVGGKTKRIKVYQHKAVVIQQRPSSSGAAALSPESASDAMRYARLQAEGEHSEQMRQRKRVGSLAALEAKFEAKKGGRPW